MEERKYEIKRQSSEYQALDIGASFYVWFLFSSDRENGREGIAGRKIHYFYFGA